MTELMSVGDYIDALESFLHLFKDQVEHLKEDIKALVRDTKQALENVIGLNGLLKEIPEEQFGTDSFWPIANRCFSLKNGIDEARVDQAAVVRDTTRMTGKLTKVLYSDLSDRRDVDSAFNKLLDAGARSLDDCNKTLNRITVELHAIDELLKTGQHSAAWTRYRELRASLSKSREDRVNEFGRMLQADLYIQQHFG